MLRYTGRVPEPSLAFLDVRVVNFDKQTIVLCGRAVFPRFTAGLTRVVDDTQRFFSLCVCMLMYMRGVCECVCVCLCVCVC